MQLGLKMVKSDEAHKITSPIPRMVKVSHREEQQTLDKGERERVLKDDGDHD